MKKLLIMSGIFFLVGLATTEVMGQSPNARSATPSSSRVQTTSTSSSNAQAERQMRKGDTQLNKANSSYQRAQTPASRPASSSATANRTNNSTPTSRPSTSTTTKPASSTAVSRPATTAPASSRVSTSSTTKPASATTVSRPSTTTTPATNSNRTQNPSANATSTSRSESPTSATAPATSEDYSKRGYNGQGHAQPQPAPVAHAGANAPKPVPYVHPNHHNFGHHMNIPPRYAPVYYNGCPYYFYNSVFCRYHNGHYVICRPPIGAVIAYSIFHTWRPVIIVHNNVNYYYDDGSFYLLARNRYDYEVVNPPIGARIAELPSNYEELILDNRVYFKVDNVYYKEVVVHGYLWYQVEWVS